MRPPSPVRELEERVAAAMTALVEYQLAPDVPHAYALKVAAAVLAAQAATLYSAALARA